jgi:hypothetical protein
MEMTKSRWKNENERKSTEENVNCMLTRVQGDGRHLEGITRLGAIRERGGQGRGSQSGKQQCNSLDHCLSRLKT